VQLACRGKSDPNFPVKADFVMLSSSRGNCRAEVKRLRIHIFVPKELFLKYEM
jgi:hypothetical protein